MLFNTQTKRPSQANLRVNRGSLKKSKALAYKHYEAALACIENYKQAAQAFNKAKTYILNAIEINPIDAESLNLLSRIELERGDKTAALNAINSAVELEPDNGGYWYSAGHALLANHQLDKAEFAFKNAIEFLPDETRAEIGLAYTYQELGEPVKAFQIYRVLIKSQPNDLQLRSLLLNAASTLKADYYDQVLENDLITYFNWEGINLSQLANLCSSLLEHKFQLNKDGSAAQFEEMANSHFLQASLKNTFIKSELLEKLIMALRYELLSHSTKNGNLSHNYIALSHAISQYGLRSEYILPVTDAEKNMVNTLKNIIDQSIVKPGCTPTDVSGALLLFAMYEPWIELNNYKQLIQFPNESWPATTFELKKENEALFSLNEYEFDTITSLTMASVNPVKSQYEAFPYPRWDKLDHKKPSNYGIALSNEYPGTHFSEALFEQPLNVLIAGCGTGRHALNVAKYFHKVNVTAIDLSKQSLSYAQSKAEELAIENISFKQADLTQLDTMKKPFDIIECSGVLHHIPDYKPALTNLLNNLKPNGLIKISLYSEYARQPINQVRELFKRDIDHLEPQKIKIIRQAILQGEVIKDTNGIISSDDFYNMSGVIDLLFHQFERQFTPSKLQALCEEFQLEWLGFSNLSEDLKQKFMTFHQDTGANLKDLNQWEAFEKENTNAFSSMYQFYCQYKPKLTLN